MESFAQRGQRENEINQEKMKRDYEINEHNEINENPNFFRLFRYFR